MSDYVTLYSHVTPFDEEHFIVKAFEIYVDFDNIKGCTRITIINADTKHKTIIYLDYIQHDKNICFNAARKVIDSGLLQ